MPFALPELLHEGFIRDLIITFVFSSVLLGIRYALRRAILRRDAIEPDMKRRWLVSVRNATFLLFLMGITLIWAREIQTVALSMVAIAAALVLATREMILCLLGSLYRTSTHAYSIGDRIEINGLKGQVIDTDLLSTTLIESNQAVAHKGTVGRLVTLPNSLLLTQPAFNESGLGRFVIHTIHVNIGRNDDWQHAETVLLAAAREAITPYSSDMVKHARDFQRRYGLGAPALVPRLRMVLNDHECIELHLQLPTPINERVTIEQRILRTFLQAQKNQTRCE
jgi:small-conductance mechanosensitive channel